MRITQPIEFVKLSGSGNDFICVDGRDGRFDDLFADGRAGKLAAMLCRRGIGVGADGLIFATDPEIEGFADVGARFFEPDGSQAELCGNGTGCFVQWAAAGGWCPNGEMKILTPAGVVRGTCSDDGFARVCIPSPEEIARDIDLTVGEATWRCDFCVTGVPHVIAYVDDVEGVDIEYWGPAFRHHERFQPRGANANFVQVLAPGRIALRTFEFGVEDETLACGTGSAAAAIMATLRFGWPASYATGREPVRVRARSGDTLRIWFVLEGDHATDVCLETLVREVFSGTVSGALVARALADPTGRTA